MPVCCEELRPRERGLNGDDRLGCLGVAYKALENDNLRKFDMKALDASFDCDVHFTLSEKDVKGPLFEAFYDAAKTKILLANLC